MRTVINKGLVITAVAAACGYVGAATISTTGVFSGTNVSREGAIGATTAVNLNAVNVTMGAFQSRDSIIQLQLTGATFVSAAISTPSVSCSSNNITLDVGAPTSASSTYDFGVTGTSGTTSNVVCTFNSLAVTRSSLATSGAVTVASGVKRTSDAAYTYDTSSSSATILSVASQIVSVAVSTAFNGVVDYQTKSGYGFVANDGTYGDQMQIVVSTRDLALSLATALSVNFAVVSESGKNFAFLDAENCGVSGSTPNISPVRSTALGRVVVTGGGSVTINSTCTTITYVATPVLTGNSTSLYYFGVELGTTSATPSTGVVIEPMTFPSFTATVSQTSVATARATGSIVPGSWTSNGATVVIPYMPINLTAGTSSIDPVVTIANRSSLVGTLTGTMRDEDGNSCTLSNLGTVQATRTKNLGGLIKEAFAGCSNLSQTSTERMYITITATLPDSTTTFYSGFTVGGSSRATVVNSTNGK